MDEFLDELFKEEINNSLENKWTLKFDKETSTAYFVDENNNKMDYDTFSFILEALKNTEYDEEEKRVGKMRKEPFDEFTRRRFKLMDYTLINDSSPDTLEVYSDDIGIFTMHSFYVRNNRRIDNYVAYFNSWDVEKMLPALISYVERCKEKKKLKI
ncbi:hypothetical protein [Aneurinibacillus tyrosinisolvens]|uniref:hypothetical protein n=1 Tax=Aneurinibacillus tyrosinisolvens TaxID=1443435 RepID=UPI00063FA4F9|nr:hypothetical protein [Aneurinibacillus tyrosinisolvens]